ncbi:MAG: hypothetical protein M0P71_17030 [Melioribacteraceae bacterium]|jgi:hypothetical protein|nr:hypothetical protein [Melioribacteraceae bacterium]
MGLPKGKTNNKRGRPPGPNKVTGELRERIKTFLDGNFEVIEKDFLSLDPEKRFALYERYLKFCVPQLQQTSVDLNIETMSEAELDLIISRILKAKQ